MMHKALYPGDNIHRLYVSRKGGGGSGLASIDDCVDASLSGLEDYIKDNKLVFGDRSRGRLESFFSIAATSRCRRRRYSFPWIVPLYP